MTSFDAAIFDMDGLLINSEPYWKIAEKKVFGALGLELSDELLRQVMGFRLPEVVAHWHRYKSWEGKSLIDVEIEILQTVKELIIEHADAMDGVFDVLKHFYRRGTKLALASSSSMNLIDAIVDKLAIRKYFQVLLSSESGQFGKPHPEIFINAAKKLGIEPGVCVVFEDSVNGVIAAKAARMYCVAVPDPAEFNDPRFSLADVKLRTLKEYLRF
jgi:sugar-phosphatase